MRQGCGRSPTRAGCTPSPACLRKGFEQGRGEGRVKCAHVIKNYHCPNGFARTLTPTALQAATRLACWK